MSSTILQEIMTAFQTDLKFREEWKENPLLACKKRGIELSSEDIFKIESLLKLKVDKSKSEELDPRINK